MTGPSEPVVMYSCTRYQGAEYPYLLDKTVRIIAVLKNALRGPLDSASYVAIRNERDLARAGGVTALDRVEVQAWMPEEERFSFLSCDARADDLACFSHLKR